MTAMLLTKLFVDTPEHPGGSQLGQLFGAVICSVNIVLMGEIVKGSFEKVQQL
jgi:hypothetical protein